MTDGIFETLTYEDFHTRQDVTNLVVHVARAVVNTEPEKLDSLVLYAQQGFNIFTRKTDASVRWVYEALLFAAVAIQNAHVAAFTTVSVTPKTILKQPVELTLAAIVKILQKDPKDIIDSERAMIQHAVWSEVEREYVAIEILLSSQKYDNLEATIYTNGANKDNKGGGQKVLCTLVNGSKSKVSILCANPRAMPVATATTLDMLTSCLIVIRGKSTSPKMSPLVISIPLVYILQDRNRLKLVADLELTTFCKPARYIV
jgi:hypothetical protein